MGCIAYKVRTGYVMFIVVRTRPVLYLQLHLKTACVWKVQQALRFILHIRQVSYKSTILRSKDKLLNVALPKNYFCTNRK
jgi:hypothetical protein